MSVERADEIALWLPRQAALVFGDAMLRTSAGQLRVCPGSWTQPAGRKARHRAVRNPLRSRRDHSLGRTARGVGGQLLPASARSVELAMVG